MFTGNNTEILNLDLEYNSSFLVYRQFNDDTKAQGTGDSTPSAEKLILPTLVSTPSPLNSGKQTVLVSSSSLDSTGVGIRTQDRNKASDIAATIYTSSDQITVNMDIYGDPDFIKQDNVSYTLSVVPENLNGEYGLVYDFGEIYAKLNFKLPIDVNLQSGLADFDFSTSAIDYKRNVFSGLYRIIKVANKFNKGLFTQHIEMIRFIDESFEPIDYITSVKTIRNQNDIDEAVANFNKTNQIRQANLLNQTTAPNSPTPISGFIG
jgi:hypothetical protein